MRYMEDNNKQKAIERVMKELVKEQQRLYPDMYEKETKK